MRTREIFRYLVAMIIALSTTVNAMAQEQNLERNLKIYFKQNINSTQNGNMSPLTKEDIILRGDIPLTGVAVTPEGAIWAKDYRIFEGFTGTPTDRIFAGYVDENTKMDSHMKISFTNFPFEVNEIQWNAMNDLLSGRLNDLRRLSLQDLFNLQRLWEFIKSMDLFGNYTINYKYTPLKNAAVEGEAIEGGNQHWNMNIFTHQITFNKGTMPGASNMTLSGLESFEFAEENYWKTLLGLYSEKVALKDECRTFIKAGWDGTSEPGTDDWAFSVKYTLPELTMECYSCRVANNVILGELDNTIIVGESGKHALRGKIAAHGGAVVPTHDPSDIDRFHYEYFAVDPNQIEITRNTGVISNAKVAGDIPVIVKLMHGTKEVCSKTEYIHVIAQGEVLAKIAIGFENGNKGYDVTVGDQNAQIKGVFTENANNIAPTEDPNGYHFEYTESSNGQIIEIDKYTGKITAKKEGDVNVSAVLKKDETIISNTYTYSLHVFAQHEGLEWHRVTTYYINNYSNRTWRINSSTRHTNNYNEESNNFSYEWKKISNLRTNMNLQNTGDWKQITGFTTIVHNYWRAICQKVGLDVKVPKYSDVQFTYTLTGDATCQNGKNYGFEVKNLDPATSEEADTKIKITWNTDGTVYPSGTTSSVIIAGAGNSSANQVTQKANVSLEKSNKENANPITDTHYLAVMSYLGTNNSNSAIAFFGYKGIPTYTYYSTVTYYMNDGTGNTCGTSDIYTSNSKTGTGKLYKNPNSSTKPKPTRAGYEFLGWSTNPEATVAEYEYQGQFCPYDDVNGGGKGPVSLYAVWEPNIYTVTLDPQGGEGGTTSVTAAYGQPMPTITVPTRPGYEFYGYFAEQPGYNDNWLNGGTRYYNSDGTSAKNWDKNDNVTLYAHWKSAKYIVTFDINGGVMQENTQYNSDASMSKLEEITDQLIKISFTYGHGGADVIINAKPKLGGFKCIGFYDDDDVLVASINPSPYNYNITINKNNKYWSGGNWNWSHDVTFTARYEPKFTYENNVLDFGTEYLELGKDWSQGVIHDVVDAARYLMTQGRVSTDNPVMVVNLNNAHYLRGDLDGGLLKEAINSQPCFSPNLLVYLKEFYNIQENQIQNGNCLNLVVTDRYPIKVLYAFDANKASYARDAKVASTDAGLEQAKNSYWGTLCLPYPIKNNTNGVKFYWLESTANNYMEFAEFGENAIIPANTPVLYCRTDGDVGSMITIEEQNVSVPENATFTPVIISYSNPQPGTYPLESVSATLQDWEFRGNLKTNVFYGAKYVGTPEEADAQIVNNGDVYYFKQNKFTHLTPARTKVVDGQEKWYNASKMTLYPYRAYFYKKGVGGSAKFSAYSILVVDEFGNTTDITNAVFGDGEGDGKIYDLNGIRVMQPVKGRLYIVNGQKKVYR